MNDLLKSLLEKLDGKKTQASILLLVVWVVVYFKVPGAKDAIGGDNFQAVAVALLGAAGISFRAAVKKLPEKTADAHEARQADPGDASPAPGDAKKEPER